MNRLAIQRARGSTASAADTPRRPAARSTSAIRRATPPLRGHRLAAIAVEPAGGRGTPLPLPVRGDMERAFRRDFSAVRVAEDPAAARRGVLAFTRGAQIRFAPGGFRPAEPLGRALLAHELMHVVQQGEARVPVTGHAAGLPVNADRGLEAEADAAAARVVRGERVAPGPQAAPAGPEASAAEPGAAPPAQMAWKKWARRLGIGLLAAGGAVGAGLLAAGAGLAAGPIAGLALAGGLVAGGLGYGAYRAYKAYKNRNRVRPRLPSDAIGGEMGGGLGEENVHFGINYGTAEGQFGARSRAMAQKGGTVAEYAFNAAIEPTHAQTPFDQDLATFHETFNRQIPVRMAKFPKYDDPSLINYDTPSGERSKYFEFAHAPDPLRADELGFRHGTRFSKSSIPFSILRGGRPRFHLDNMANVDQLLQKQGPYADSVTSRELRFVRRYWDRPIAINDEHGRPKVIKLKDHVMFYDNMRRVNPPW